MVASFFNLVDNVSGTINRRQLREPPEALPIEQGVRWIPDEDPLPVFDASFQALVADQPVNGAAIEVTYTVVSTSIEDLRVTAKQQLEQFTLGRVVFAAISEADTQDVRDVYQAVIDLIDNETDPATVANLDFSAEPWPVGSLST